MRTDSRSPSRRAILRRTRLLLVLGIGWLAILGCQVREPNNNGGQGYLPDSATARKAVESALTAWRDGAAAAELAETSEVQFVDKHRKPGQRLLGFQVLGEVEVQNARQFTVKLELDQEEEPQLVRYNVFGLHPIWVFRLEDYELISHWDHKMDDPGAASIPANPPVPAASKTP